MNYRDLVLKLLKKRKEVVVIEALLRAEFAHSDDPEDAFEKWCHQNFIVKTKVSGSKNIVLSKALSEKTP